MVEKSNYHKCIENAKKYRISEERARLCDLSRPLCPKCIFEVKEDDKKRRKKFKQ